MDNSSGVKVNGSIMFVEYDFDKGFEWYNWQYNNQ